jgi:hypothetical protein
MSGEATSRVASSAAALERAFGAEATCNRCAARVEDYRVVVVFLHDTAAVRAYCRDCYPVAVDGSYFARGSGDVLEYAAFGERFGSPGPAPPPATPVDRILAALVRDPALVSVSPRSEAGARRLGALPYRFRVELSVGGAVRAAVLVVSPKGRVVTLEGDDAACALVKRAVGTNSEP